MTAKRSTVKLAQQRILDAKPCSQQGGHDGHGWGCECVFCVWTKRTYKRDWARRKSAEKVY